MIIGKDFIFVHTQRTAGTFTQKLIQYRIRNCISFIDIAMPYAYDDQFLSKYFTKEFLDWFYRIRAQDDSVVTHSALNHSLPIHLKPIHWLDKKVYFFVRNPIQWWVSHYNKACSYEPDIELNQFILDNLDKEYGQDGVYRTMDDLKGVAYKYVMKYEYLYSNLIHMFDDMQYPLAKEDIEQLLSLEPLNTSDLERSSRVLKGSTIQQIRSATNNKLVSFYYDDGQKHKGRDFMGG